MLQSMNATGQRGTYVMPLSSRADVVFGLDWTPLVGGDQKKLGPQRARAIRATHYLIMGDPAAVVGFGTLHKQDMRIKIRSEGTRPLHAAAAIFALAHQEGVVAAISFVPEKGYWFVAANGGLVLAHTDRWFDGVEEADAAVQILKERFPTLQVFRYALIDASNQPEWMQASMSAHSHIQKLPSRGRLSLTLAGLGLLIVGFCSLWLREDTVAPILSTQESDSALWQQVLDRFAHAHPIHSPEQLFKVVRAWHQAPVGPGGWKLQQIVCEPSNMDWHCAARYHKNQRLALSQHLDAAKPEGWTLEFPDLDHGTMHWKVLDAASLFERKTPSVSLKDWLSYLQSVTPVFESIQIGSGTQLTLPAPMNQQGLVLKIPPHIKPIKKRMISIKGPLRSISVLRGLAVPVRWRSLQLELGVAVGQGVSRSGLTVSLMGDVFEFAE